MGGRTDSDRAATQIKEVLNDQAPLRQIGGLDGTLDMPRVRDKESRILRQLQGSMHGRATAHAVDVREMWLEGSIATVPV
jgi:hypothetical protein